MTVYPLQATFSRGALTPLLHARAETEHYVAGLHTALNIVVTRFGGVTRVPGSIYGGNAKSQVLADTTRLLPFRFNRSQVYCIEAGNLYFRFWVWGANGPEQVESGGSPVEVVTPFATADLPNLKVQQSGDVIYIVCVGHKSRVLTRNSETSWTLTEYEAQDGPYMPLNITNTTLQPAETGHITPQMTGLTTPSGTVTSDTSQSAAFSIFDRNKVGRIPIANTDSGWVAYQFDNGEQYVADAYWITASSANAAVITIKQWEFQGSNDGSNWVTLDSRDGQDGWIESETRYYEFENNNAFEYYRLKFSGGENNTTSRIGELAIHQKASDQTPFDLTASAVTGINDDTGFQSTDVGRTIRLLGSDGRWRWVEIVSVTSTTVVTVRLHGHALPDTSPIIQWKMGLWSEETGWPETIGIYEDRIVMAGSDGDPTGVSATRSADYDNYGVSDPLLDDDAVNIRLTGGELNKALWVASGRDILIGTEATIRAVGRNDETKAFAPSNFRQKPEASVGSSNIQPVQIEKMLLFIDAARERLYEMAFEFQNDGYTARELSVLNEHLFAYGIADVKYQESPHKILWSLREDGDLIASTYDRNQQVFGSTEVDYVGVVESILALPDATNDRTNMFMVVRRTVNGGTVRYIEGMAEFWRNDYAASDLPIYGASSLTYDGAATGSVSGLDHLEGETVGIWADGRDIGDATVSSGSITLPNGITASQIVVGLRMTWEMQTLRLNNTGNKDGSMLGRKISIEEAYIDFYEAAGVKVNSLISDESVMQFEDEIEMDPLDPTVLRTGSYPVTIDDSWKNNGQLKIGGDRMYPATIRALVLGVDGEP